MRSDQDVSVFDFDSVSSYLSAVFRSRKIRRRRFSLRGWATRIGLKASDSGNLSRVLSGQRELSRPMVDKLARDLALEPGELAYFEVLAMGRERISPESLARLKEGLHRLAARDRAFPGVAEIVPSNGLTATIEETESSTAPGPGGPEPLLCRRDDDETL